MNEIPGSSRTVPKQLSLDELAEMTKVTQQAEREGYMTDDYGRPLKRVATVDLTPKDDYDPLVSAKLASQAPSSPAPPQEPQQYMPPRTSNLKPTPIEEIAPYKEPEEVGKEMKNKLIGDLDKAIARDKAAMWNNVVEPLYEQALADKLEADDSDLLSDSDDTYNNEEGDFTMDTTPAMTSTNIAPVNNFEFDEEPILTTQTVQPEEQEEPEELPRPAVTVPAINSDVTAIPDLDTKAVEPEVQEPSLDDVEPEGELSQAEDLSNLDLNDMFGEDIEDELTEVDLEPEVELSEEDKKEEIVQMQQVIRKTANPISKVINLAEYTIASKPVTSSRVLASMASTAQIHTANWVLPHAGRSITMTELSGPEIEKLNPGLESGLSDLLRNKELYSIFYNHIIDANKPKTFDAWTKTVPFEDIPHLYFAAYRASFSHGTNLLPLACNNPKCKHSFMQHTPINSMVKFKDDAAKLRTKTIMGNDPTSDDYSIVSKLFQVSDSICISFKAPSIYNRVFETSVLPEKFRNSYQDLLGVIQTIDSIYQINHAEKKLVKMETKIEANDVVKTTFNKYKSYAAILQQLKADEYYAIPAFIKEVRTDRSDEITFQLPEVVCPKCGKTIPAAEMDAISLLFTRLRLQTILVL